MVNGRIHIKTSGEQALEAVGSISEMIQMSVHAKLDK